MFSLVAARAIRYGVIAQADPLGPSEDEELNEKTLPWMTTPMLQESSSSLPMPPSDAWLSPWHARQAQRVRRVKGIVVLAH